MKKSNSVTIQQQVSVPLHIEVVGSATDKGNGECWVNIGARRLESASEKQGIIMFVCVIASDTYVYQIPASTLNSIFKEKNVTININRVKYDFRIEYKTGRLLRNNKKKELIIDLISMSE